MNQMVTRKTLSPEDVFATIKRAHGSNAGWVVVASSVDAFRKSGDWRDYYPSPTDWLNAAAKEAGVTTNTLRRMISAAEFLKTKSPVAFEESLRASLQSPKLAFGTVELIKRIDDIAPVEADKALALHLDSKLSFREAKKQYDWVAGRGGKVDVVFANPPWGSMGPAKIASHRAHAKRSALHRLVESHISSMSGIDPFCGSGGWSLLDRHSFKYVRPDVAAVGKPEGEPTFVDGFDLQTLPAGWSQTSSKKIISEIAFNASFFRRYWIVLDSDPEDAKELSKSFDELSLYNVGIALLAPGEQDDLKLIRSPAGKPDPDRQSLAIHGLPLTLTSPVKNIRK